MIKIFNEGHTEKGFCAKCKAVTGVTFKYKPYLTEGGDTIPEVLQGFCDGCGDRLLLPPQSIPKIQPYYIRQNKIQEYKVPVVIEDALLNIGSIVRLEKPDTFKTILRFYLTNPNSQGWIKHTDVKRLGPSRARLSFRVDEITNSLLMKRADNLAISKNQFISMIIWDAKDRLTGKSKESKLYTNEIKLFRSPEYA